MEKKGMTLEEVLRITADNLSNIQIPVTMAESVGMMIAGSIKNIQLCINAIEEGKQEEAKNQEAPEVEEDGRETDPE